MTLFGTALSGLGIAVMVFLILLAILWFFLPFAVFGTKPLLTEILTTQKAILAQLKARDRAAGPAKASAERSPSEKFLDGPRH